MASEFYEDLVRRSDILAVARELGLEVRGTKCRCLRPNAHAHGDRSPSLYLNRRTNTFRCWVCPDIWGSVIDLVMLARGLPREDAVAYLAARAGMPLPESGRVGEWGSGRTGERRHRTAGDGVTRSLVPIATKERPQPRPRRDSHPLTPSPAPPLPHSPPPAILTDEQVHAVYARFLKWCDRPGPRNYLTVRRGISHELLERMRIVWVRDPAGIEAHLRDDATEEELVASGLLNEWGLIFRSYPVIFPFLQGERVRFLQGRRVDSREPKYLSVRRPIPCLYNHDLLATLAAGDPVVLCEGVIDTLTWLDQGVAAVGILGVGTFKAEWMEALRPFRVLLALDSDAPGVRAARSLRERFAAAGQDARIVALPPGVKDVNELFVEHPDLVSALVADASR